MFEVFDLCICALTADSVDSTLVIHIRYNRSSSKASSEPDYVQDKMYWSGRHWMLHVTEKKLKSQDQSSDPSANL